MPALPLEPEDPRAVGRYRITGRLGEGGQGIVYAGEAPDGQRVAVKMLKTTSPEARGRFVREMDAARQVAPFATAAVLDSLVEGLHPYVVSEYVEGPSLQERVAEGGPLRGGELHRLMVNTASALTAIHGAAIVHRDLKPANVLLGPDGPRVVDFGIARAVDAQTHTAMVGTPSYFAPEWLEGAQPTRASDVFAWAGTMVFAATGHPPFGSGTSVPATLHRIATAPAELNGVPAPLQPLLAECLDKDPARRPTARALLVRLADPSASAARTHENPAPAPSPPPAYAPAPPQTPVHLHHVTTGPLGPPGRTDPMSGLPSGPPPGPRRGRRGQVIAAVAGTVVLLAVLGAGVVLLLNDREPGGDPARRAKGSPSTEGSPAQTAQGQTGQASPGGGSGPATVPAAVAGTWRGQVTQPDGLASDSSSDVEITLEEGKTSGTASYGTWGCRSTLEITSSSATGVEVRENITGGPPGCTGGTLSLTRQGGGLQFRSQGLGTVTGTLSRKG